MELFSSKMKQQFKLSEEENRRIIFKIEKFENETIKCYGSAMAYCKIKIINTGAVKIDAKMESGFKSGPHYIDKIIIDRSTFNVKMI